MAKSAVKTMPSAIVKRTVAMPVRLKNADLRTREYLTNDEVQRLAEAAKANRHGQRDATMILVAYRHGLRASELTDLRWDQVEFTSATLHVRRVKQGTPSTHPILGDELRALRRLQREQEPRSPFVFTSERDTPFATAGFARMVERAGVEAGLGSKLTRICCDMLAATPWPTGDTTRGRCKPTWATGIFSTRSGTQNCRLLGSRIFGGKRCTHARGKSFLAGPLLKL
jgi:integrase